MNKTGGRHQEINFIEIAAICWQPPAEEAVNLSACIKRFLHFCELYEEISHPITIGVQPQDLHYFLMGNLANNNKQSFPFFLIRNLKFLIKVKNYTIITGLCSEILCSCSLREI